MTFGLTITIDHPPVSKGVNPGGYIEYELGPIKTVTVTGDPEKVQPYIDAIHEVALATGLMVRP